jgi:phospholipid transport system substrate-binding protein
MLLVGVWLGGSAEAASPTETLRATYAEANAIITALMTGESPIDSFDALFIGNRLTAIATLFSKAFDFRGAAERALGAQWKARTAAEQKDFTALFANFVQRGFMSWLASVAVVDKGTGGMTVHYLGETVDRDRASVRTSIRRRGGGEVRLDHNMVYLNTRWAVRDVTIDGVSLVANYRAQFERVIRTFSYQDLVERMQMRLSSPLPTPGSGRGEDLNVDRPSQPPVEPSLPPVEQVAPPAGL